MTDLINRIQEHLTTDADQLLVVIYKERTAAVKIKMEGALKQMLEANRILSDVTYHSDQNF